jgi:hypothetical protein
MTLPATPRRAGPFEGNGATTAFPFSFKLFDEADIQVLLVAADGVEDTLVLDSDYTVVLNADQDAMPGGAVHYPMTGEALASPDTLTVVGSLPYDQQTDLPTGGAYRAQVVENTFDRVVMQIQQLVEQAGRTLALSPTADTGVSTQLPPPEANRLIGWNEDADALQNVDAATLGAIVAFGTAVPDLFTGDGTRTQFTLSGDPGVRGNLDVSVEGLVQRVGIDFDWSSGTQLVFAVAPPAGSPDNILVRYIQALPQASNPDLGDTTDPGKGDALVGVVQPFTGAVARTQHDKNAESVSVLDFIPAAEHAAIRGYTSAFDCTDAFNTALGACRRVRVPAGGYLTRRPINMTARGVGGFEFTGRQLIGDGVSGTIINAYPGPYPCIDLTGSSACEIYGINFRSDNPGVAPGLAAADCASIGIVIRRGNTSAYTRNCHQPRLIGVRFDLTSAMARNVGVGTVGLYCCGAEHVVTDHFEASANVPFVAENTPTAGIARSQDHPTHGGEYEPVLASGVISTTIHEHRSMLLVAWDSFRAMRLEQVANFEFPSLYTSTRKLVSALPAYAETFDFTSVANVRLQCYQEASGKFGTTYRMDHRYFTFTGPNDGVVAQVRRGANDYGFTLPGAPAPSIHLNDGAALANSRIDCNYLFGVYNDSGNNCGFATLPVTFSGTPNRLWNLALTLDHGTPGHWANVLGALSPWCTNVESTNFLSGDRGYADALNEFTVVMAGGTTAGVASGVSQTGRWRREGNMVHVFLSYTCTGHTGTGQMKFRGFPFTAKTISTGAVFYQATTMVMGGRDAVALIITDTDEIVLWASDPGGGGGDFVPVDPTTNLILQVSFPV